MKAEVLEWYQKNRLNFSSRSDAAMEAAKSVAPVKFRTALEWLKDAKE